jgi:hypothetical protein
MTLVRIAQHVRDLEAITRYEPVLQERDEALSRQKTFAEELSRTRIEYDDKVRKLTSQNKALGSTIQDKENKIGSLSKSLEDKDKELKATQQVIINTTAQSTIQANRIRELESLKVMADGKTLGDVEQATIKAREQEIERRAQQKAGMTVQSWRTTQKQGEVEDEAIRQLGLVLDLMDGHRTTLPVTLLPLKVRHVLDREIERRQWPLWLEKNVEPKAADLEAKFNQNVFTALKGAWQWTCDKCNAPFEVEFTTENVELLLQSGSIRVLCLNPNCNDLFGRHSIKMTLRDLIYYRLTAPT